MFSYLQKRGRTYYYRIKVPSDLASAFPSLEIKRSLKTDDKRAAITLATAYHSKVQNTFALLRAGTVTAVQIPALISGVLGTDKSFRVIEAPASTLPTFGKLVSLYQQEKEPKWSEKTKLEFAGIFGVLLDLLGNKPIDRYNREDAVNCRESLAKLPSNFKKSASTKFKPIQQVIVENTLPTIHPKTVNKHVVLLSSLFKYAMLNGHISTNPIAGLTLPISKDVQSERKTYTIEELRQIVANLPRFESAPEKFWVPMIAMYSGMRLDEICQLHTEDILAGC